MDSNVVKIIILIISILSGICTLINLNMFNSYIFNVIHFLLTAYYLCIYNNSTFLRICIQRLDDFVITIKIFIY